MYVPSPEHSPSFTDPSTPPPVCIITTAVYGQHLGYRTFVVRDAIGSHDLHSWDDKRLIRGRELVDSACDLMSDAMAVVIETKDILD
jgi:hypothetical protein